MVSNKAIAAYITADKDLFIGCLRATDNFDDAISIFKDVYKFKDAPKIKNNQVTQWELI